MTFLIMAGWAVAALWAVAVVELFSLALRRGRRAVRRGLARGRAALVAGALGGVLVTAGCGFVAPSRALAALPLLVVPAAVALWRGLPPLGALTRVLLHDPWGPSDPRTRRDAADPLVTVPPAVALAGAVAAVPVLAGGLVAALVAYGLTAGVTAALAWWAPRRREHAARAGVLRRVVVRAAEPLTAPREAA
jgi:hypothetical protein